MSEKSNFISSMSSPVQQMHGFSNVGAMTTSNNGNMMQQAMASNGGMGFGMMNVNGMNNMMMMGGYNSRMNQQQMMNGMNQQQMMNGNYGTPMNNKNNGASTMSALDMNISSMNAWTTGNK
jgi:hypothetical protein